MTLTTSPYISSVVYVLNFKKPALKVRYQQAEAEAAFGGLVNAQSQQTNFPDQADPSQPRIVFHAGPKTLVISQLACQLQMGFEKSSQPFSKQLSIARKNAMDFHERALRFRDKSEYGMSGLVFDINFQSENPQSELNNYLYSQFIKPSPIGEVASIQLNLGFKIDNLFLTLGSAVYETREFKFQGGTFGSTVFEIETQPITESGITMKLDINDRPKGLASEIENERPDIFLDAMEHFIKTHLSSISGLSF